MSLNDNKPTYGTVPAVDSGATKGSRRGLVVGLVRPRARKSIHGTPSTRRLTTPKIGPIPTPHTETNGIFGPSGSPLGAGGFNGGKPLMGPGFPFDGGDSMGWGTGPTVNMGAGTTGPGGEHVGGYKTKGY